jgi:hypothetical protein
MGELSGFLNRDGLEIGGSRVTASALAGLLRRLVDGTVSGKLAKDVFEAMWAEGKDANAIIEAKGLKQITDTGRDREGYRRRDGRESAPARGLPLGQGQAVRLLRRPGDESDRRQGQPGAGERPPEAHARGP